WSNTLLPTILLSCPLPTLKRRLIRIRWFRSGIRWCVDAASESDHSAEGIIARSRFVEVGKLGVLANEFELHTAYGSVPVLGNDDLTHSLGRHAVFVNCDLVILGTVKEHDDVGVLFDGARLPQVRQLRTLVTPTCFDPPT